MAGGADLPSMVDTLPTFDEDYGSRRRELISRRLPEGEGTDGGTGGSGTVNPSPAPETMRPSRRAGKGASWHPRKAAWNQTWAPTAH